MALRTSRSAVIANTLGRARELDRKFLKTPSAGGQCTPWMPYDCAEFSMMLLEAIAEADSHTFLDVGCGPGSKMLIARDIFGLDAFGIDVIPSLIDEAHASGLHAGVADALAYSDYGRHGIVWLNRPYRDAELEAALEAKVWGQMAPGSVVICANLEAPPPSDWLIVLDDWEVRRGVWRKPL